MGAVTVTIQQYTVQGNFQARTGILTMSSSYATGGDTITAAQMGLDRVVFLSLNEGNNSNATSQEIDLYPVASTFQTSKIQAFGDGGNNPGGPLIEAGSATNLSTYSTQFVVYGF